MKIQLVQWYPYRVPLYGSLNTAHENLATRDGVIVEIQTDNGITGFGESAPLPEFSGGTLSDVLYSLPRLTRQLQGQDLIEALHNLQASEHVDATYPSSAIYGIETALLDALGRQEHKSIAALLTTTQQQVPRTAIQVNAMIGVQSLDESITRAQTALVAGFSCIKLKVGVAAPEEEITRIQAVRNVIGPDIQLRLDANEAWDFSQAQFILSRCENLNIQYIEQPLSRHDLSGLARLRQSVAIPIAVDEMLSDSASARRVIDAQAADIFILKPQLAGGLAASQRIISTATMEGIQCVITSTIETGVGITAALHLACAMPEITLACGLATLPLLTKSLIQEPLPVQDGMMKLPEGDGSGIHIEQAIRQHDIKTA
jgi:o-succinylbenzoate synthase